MRVVEGWREAAAKIDFAGALDGAYDLSREQYEALHDGRPVEVMGEAKPGTFVVERVGRRNDADFADIGVEYYAYVS